MHRSFTLNDLILFAYSEPEAEDADSYKSFINGNKILSKDYKTICRIRHYFTRKKVGPSKSTITNILNYSKALSVNRTENAGIFGLLLN
jgi:hypothetical protein